MPMPELPEVETIRISLAPLIGQRVEQVSFSKLAPVETTTPAKIRQALTDSTIIAIRRWGKYLLIDVDRRATLVIHLGMTGRLLINPPTPPLSKGGKGGFSDHHHMSIQFADGSRLVLFDPRRFGTISLSSKPDGSDNRFLSRLGPDYLDPALTPEIFITRCRRHPGLSLKSLLLHQGIAAGLGNIYACEALYRAGLSPKRRVRRAPDDPLSRLLSAAREILQLAIKNGGTTLRDYQDSLGRKGQMQNFLKVYAREGLPTADGHGMVKRIWQQGRSTWFCPEVQK